MILTALRFGANQPIKTLKDFVPPARQPGETDQDYQKRLRQAKLDHLGAKPTGSVNGR